MKKSFFLLPVTVVIVLTTLLFRNIGELRPSGLSSSLIDEPVPAITLPALDPGAKRFTSADLKAGHVTVLNVWASWCVPCRTESAALAEISLSRDAKLYGIVYEDNAKAARDFLRQTGNPFARLDLDVDGRTGRSLGIYGVPETFVIDRKGIVRFRYAGPIVANTLTRLIMPAIATADREN